MTIIDKISPRFRVFILIFLDAFVSTCSLSMAFVLMMDRSAYSHWWLFPILIVIRLITFHSYGLYMYLWRYATLREVLSLVKAITLSSLLMMSILFITKTIDFPKRLLFLEWALNIIFVGGFRIGLRLYRDAIIMRRSEVVKEIDKVRVLIIGAGDAGEMIAREIQRVASLKYKLIGFIDDKPNKTGQIIHQTPVLGSTAEMADLVKQYQIQEVFIAIPSATGKDVRRIVKICEECGIQFKITPGLYEILGGRVSVNQLREVRIEDLLGRQVVNTDMDSISKYLSKSVVLVTGAGGSIGSELCRQIVRFAPGRIILLDNNENAIYFINMEIRRFVSEANLNVEVVSIVGDIRDREHLDAVIKKYKPVSVFHAAAYKHVPLMEENIESVVRNNIIGTKNMLELSDAYGVKNFVLISTDKAVYPVNCMGAAKRIGEVMMQLFASKSKTQFSAVRFGNVLDSQGSVVPLFRMQIAEGGPVTVTHPEVTRFFMTIPEAIRLIIQAGALNQGGEIFILDMGEPVKIYNLAKDLIHLSGLEADKDIEIVFTGLRPGEKLEETLFFDKEKLKSTVHDKIFIAEPYPFDPEEIRVAVDRLIQMCYHNTPEAIREQLFYIVERTQPKA